MTDEKFVHANTGVSDMENVKSETTNVENTEVQLPVEVYACGIYRLDEHYHVVFPQFPELCIFDTTLAGALRMADKMLNDAVVEYHFEHVGDKEESLTMKPNVTDDEVFSHMRSLVEDTFELPYDEKMAIIHHVVLNDLTVSILKAKFAEETIMVNEQVSHMAAAWASRLGMSYDEYVNTALDAYNQQLISSNSLTSN